MKTLAVWYRLDEPGDGFESVSEMDLPAETETEMGFDESPTKTLLSTVEFELDPQLIKKLSRGVKDEEKWRRERRVRERK